MINRRQFLMMKVGRGGSLELSCERLYMAFVDSRADGSVDELFSRLEQEFCGRRRLALRDIAWLNDRELRERVDVLLTKFRANGGRVEVDIGGADPSAFA